MYGLIYRFGQFDMFIYGFLAVASLCASVAYRLAAWLVQEPTVIRIYGFTDLFYFVYIGF